MQAGAPVMARHRDGRAPPTAVADAWPARALPSGPPRARHGLACAGPCAVCFWRFYAVRQGWAARFGPAACKQGAGGAAAPGWDDMLGLRRAGRGGRGGCGWGVPAAGVLF